MSVSVRIPQYLADRARELAEQERRSFANMVEVLIEEGLAARGTEAPEPPMPALVSVETRDNFKPDFKKGQARE